MTTFGMKRIRRWHSRMCSRASLALSMTLGSSAPVSEAPIALSSYW